jgi:UrcA family protein
MSTTLSTSLRTLAAAAILGSAAFGFAPVASAAETSAPPHVTVKFADLNVSTAHGAAVLYGRIQYAAEEVCMRMYISTEAYKHFKNACLKKSSETPWSRSIDRPYPRSSSPVSAPVLLAAAATR